MPEAEPSGRSPVDGTPPQQRASKSWRLHAARSRSAAKARRSLVAALVVAAALVAAAVASSCPPSLAVRVGLGAPCFPVSPAHRQEAAA